MNSQLKKAFDYFLEHHDQLVERFDGKFVVIHDDKVIGPFESALQAVSEAEKTMKIGTFLVQKVEPGTSSYTQTFHSRVAFS